MTTILETICSSAISRIKSVAFWVKFHWNLFPQAALTTSQVQVRHLTITWTIVWSTSRYCVRRPQWVNPILYKRGKFSSYLFKFVILKGAVLCLVILKILWWRCQPYNLWCGIFSWFTCLGAYFTNNLTLHNQNSMIETKFCFSICCSQTTTNFGTCHDSYAVQNFVVITI